MITDWTKEELLEKLDDYNNEHVYYDKAWFSNDLDIIFNKYNEIKNDRYFSHQVGLWLMFLDNCKMGKYR